ncbi:MAG: hypothetical protein R3A46_21080 [Thermomicrobiales bacterium]
MTATATPHLLPAVFEDRQQAEAAIDALQRAGYSDEEIGVAAIEQGHYKVLDEEAHEVLMGLSKGAAVGVPAGAISGLALLAVLVPGMGTITANTAILAMTKGIWWGAIIGGWTGLMTKMRWDYDEDRWVDIPLNSGDVLVAVAPHGHYDDVHKIMKDNGARWFLDPTQPQQPLHVPPVLD